jgi:UDP-N-acetylglucosamine 2-epimerase (non-hydrolysing)
MKKIISVVGARPNFMKVAPIHKAFEKVKYEKSNVKRQMSNSASGAGVNNESSIQHLICHTGQHYDQKMSQIFFDELNLPKPDFYLGIGGGSHGLQTGRVMIEFEKVLLTERPDLVIVVGDVNSTIACSLTAVKLGIKVAHVEAGLRSFDRSMPEEINRILTDSISDYLFVTEPDGLKNLKNEGVSEKKIFYVGNTMIDSLVHLLPKINSSTVIQENEISNQNYVVATFHRPSNVDSEENLKSIIMLLNKIAREKKVIFPVHPRTKKKLEEYSLLATLHTSLTLTDPIGYIDFIALIKNSALVITDSGGIQEETTFLGVPCITIRKTTERPITVEIGTNVLVGENFNKAYEISMDIMNGKIKKGTIPELWDGKTAERIVKVLVEGNNCSY